MSTRGWHMVREAGLVTLSRQLPVRFDVSVLRSLPAGSATRFAHQIRQDIWRALQNVRGFSPEVQLTQTGSGWDVRAGGRVLGRPAGNLVDRLADVLDDPAKRARWIRYAQANLKELT